MCPILKGKKGGSPLYSTIVDAHQAIFFRLTTGKASETTSERRSAPSSTNVREIMFYVGLVAAFTVTALIIFTVCRLNRRKPSSFSNPLCPRRFSSRQNGTQALSFLPFFVQLLPPKHLIMEVPNCRSKGKHLQTLRSPKLESF